MQDALPTLGMILVVVPDRELRRSIEFALEAEGLVFCAHAELAAALASPEAGAAACLIVDEDAIAPSRNGAGNGLDGFGRPVVLLVDRMRTVPRVPGIRVLNKPLLGERLIEIVAGSIAGGLRNYP